ncbi:MAG: hypothetical protein Q7S76_00575 [bacterium]|nr:hypothetical protein [bacterium]
MDIEDRIQKIEERNLRVEADKAWETSALRIGSIMLATYIIAYGVLVGIGNSNALRNALIPVVGYFLSTQSLPFLKRSWISRYLASRRK